MPLTPEKFTYTFKYTSIEPSSLKTPEDIINAEKQLLAFEFALKEFEKNLKDGNMASDGPKEKPLWKFVIEEF